MNLWESFNIKINSKKRRRRRWRFIQKEFRPLFKYFKKKDKHLRYYEFRRYLKLMKKINKIGWIEFVKKTLDKQMKKQNNI
jgi:hypothetical protein